MHTAGQTAAPTEPGGCLLGTEGYEALPEACVPLASSEAGLGATAGELWAFDARTCECDAARPEPSFLEAVRVRVVYAGPPTENWYTHLTHIL